MKPIIVYSPSNMMSYASCPRKFMGQSVTKQIRWKASKSKTRGSLVHGDVQEALKHGTQVVKCWQQGMDVHYTQQKIEEARAMVSRGALLYIEQELCIDKTFRKTDWWSDTALLRARADALILRDAHTAYVVDIKSGRKYDDEDFQLRVEALLIHLLYQRPIVNYEYWYVDQGETVEGSIDFRNGLYPVQDIIDLIKAMNLAIRDNNFPPKVNRFCRWCDFFQTPDCGL